MSDRFEQVTVVKKANVYFDGKVTSRTVWFPDGSRKTLGVMLPGSYEFGTDAAEIMEVLAGEMTVCLPGDDAWQTFKAGESFNVPANAKFQLEINCVADYCCSYCRGKRPAREWGQVRWSAGGRRPAQPAPRPHVHHLPRTPLALGCHRMIVMAFAFVLFALLNSTACPSASAAQIR